MALIVYNKENSRPQQVVYQGSGQSTWTARERFTCQRQCLLNWGFSVEDGLISHTMRIRENGISAIRQTRTGSLYGKIKVCQILCRIHRQKNHASGKSGKEDRTVYDCQSSHRGGRYSILQDSAFQSDFQIARRWLRKIHYQIMVMDFSGLCCLDFYIILFGALGYCLVRALYWHNTMS